MTDSDNGRSIDETPPADSAEAEAEAKAKEEAAAKAKAAKAKVLAEAEAAKEPWERDPSTPSWDEVEDSPLVDSLRAAHADAVLSARSFAGDLILEIDSQSIRDVCRSLKDEHGYKLFVDSCGAHFDKRDEKELEVVYILHNLEANDQVRLKVRIDEGDEVPSVAPVYAGANWSERETYDMYGIRFTDHPDMTRILLWEGFNGHPLLKDFPVEGIDTGAAIYPETYTDNAGPVAGTGTGWRPPAPPEEKASQSDSEPAGEDS
jgi:NADH-quinone oxidoreductase subunit C